MKKHKYLFILVAVLSICLFHNNKLNAANKYCTTCGQAMVVVCYDDIPCDMGPAAYAYVCDNDLCVNYGLHVDTFSQYHHYYSLTSTTAATCDKDGKRVYTCNVCHKSYSDAIKATGHKYQDSVIDPTCVEEGSIVHTCSVCGDVQTEAVEALGHIYDDVVVDPTCTEKGTTTPVCTVCGYEDEEHIIETEALGHVITKEWVVEEEPTYFKTGKKTTTCDICSTKMEMEIDKLPFPIVPVATGATAVVATIGYLILKGMKAKKITKLSPVELDFSAKSIFCLLDENDFSKSIINTCKSRPYLDVTTSTLEDLDEVALSAKKDEYDLILLDVNENHSLEEVTSTMETISAKYEDATYALAIDKDMLEALKERLDALVEEETIASYFSNDQEIQQFLIHQILPLYKPEINVDNSLEALGKVADLLGFEVLGKAIEVFTEGKNIKEQFEDEDFDADSAKSITYSIATILGLETVTDVLDFTDNLETVKDAIDKDTGVSEAKDAATAAADVIDVVKDILDK